jgi:hypothetical protein
MQKAILLFAAVTLAAAPLTAQTPAPSVARPRATAVPTSDSSKFDAIRGRFRRELATERAALQRTRDRMREELTAAGWHPRMRQGEMRMRMASFRGRMRNRMMMRRGAMMGRRQMMMRRRPMMTGRGATPMMGRRGPPMMGGRGGGQPMGRGQGPGRPGAVGNDSTRAMRRPPPRVRPDSGT